MKICSQLEALRLVTTVATLVPTGVEGLSPESLAQGQDPLPSWNDGAAKQAILNFVRVTTSSSSGHFVPAAERVACFDQDGTTWVEQPIYTQVIYCLDRVPDLVKAKPELANEKPFKTVMSGDRAAMAKLPTPDLYEILGATLTGMTVDTFRDQVQQWITTARDPRWKKLYTELTYQPMLEVMSYLRANGYRTYFVTGGGQDFVRVYCERVYGVPLEQIVGSMGGTTFGYDTKDPILTKDPKLLLNNDNAGKPEGIHVMIGRIPHAAFGNSIGDREMLDYTKSGGGERLAMLVLHDDKDREYAYGPALGLPDSRIGKFPQTLYNEAEAKGWPVISMKRDWKRIFAFET